MAIYDPFSRALTGQIQTATNLRTFHPADLDGDGIMELICLTYDSLIVFDLSGSEIWRVAGAGGYKVAVGQMDADAGSEIAISGGKVIDVDTRSVQWAQPGTQWGEVVVTDLDGDGMEELLVSGSPREIRALDVDTQSTKWVYQPSYNASTLRLANLDGDSPQELLYQDQNGPMLHAMDIGSGGLTEKWQISNPGRRTWGMAVGDLDGDGSLELAWSSSITLSEVSQLHVTGIPSLLDEWASLSFERPFVGVCKGDVTGDGIPEYVFASVNNQRRGGPIQVVDSNTLSLIGASDSLLDNSFRANVLDVNLCDVDGDGRFEIAATGDGGGSRVAEILRFDFVGGFERLWKTPPGYFLSDSNDGERVEVLDVDGDGDLEVILAGQRSSWDTSSYLMVFDYDSGIEQWRSPGFPGGWNGPVSLSISDVDTDGRIEAVMGCGGSGFEVYDLGLKIVEQTVNVPDLTCIATRFGTEGILVGTSEGKVARFVKNQGAGYAAMWQAGFVPDRIEHLIPSFGDRLFAVTRDRVFLNGMDGSVYWETISLPEPLSHRISPLHTIDGWEVATNTGFGASGFPLQVMDGESVVDLHVSGALRENGSDPATVVITRHLPGPEPLLVRFFLSGRASVDSDFDIAGAVPGNDGLWEATIPANLASAVVSLVPLDDVLAEGDETIDLVLAEGEGYLTGPDHVARARIVDDETTVGVYFTRKSIRESDSVATSPGAEAVFIRTGDLSRPLKVSYATYGSATNGKDFSRLKGKVVFKAGIDRVAFGVVAPSDRSVEGEEFVGIELSPDSAYGLKLGAEVAEMTIEDVENTVELVEAIPGKNGLSLLLHRRSSYVWAQKVSVQETRTFADGSVKSFTRRVSFRKGSYEGLVKIPGGKTSARIEWSLIDDKTFIPTGMGILGYDWNVAP